MESSVKSIEQDQKIKIDLQTIDYNDPHVFKMLSIGDVSGVFQLANQAHLLMEQDPNCFEDIIAINALLRPGVGDWNEYIARRNGKKYYLHPLRKPYLLETFGIIAYQEQYELDCKTFAGWTIAYADKHVRKNYNLASDDNLAQKFIRDGLSKGFTEKLLVTIWSEITHAATGGYSFNKAHTVSYAILSYQSAWLKYYYPSHFYASLMTKEGDDQDVLANLVAEIRRKGLSIIPPDINISTNNFVAKGNDIYYRLTSITQVGNAAIKSINRLRPIDTLEHLIDATARTDLKTNVIINLIKAGCFDYDEPNRFTMLNRAQKALDIIEEDYPKFDSKQKSIMEKQSIGIYLSSHPLDQYYYEPFYKIKNNTKAITAGEVIEVNERKDKNGNTMAFITLSNQYGNIKCLIFAGDWNNRMKEIFYSSQFIAVSGMKSGTSLLIKKASKLILD